MAMTILNSIRNNGSTPEQVLAAAAMIASEYKELTLGELKQIAIDGMLQKFNKTNQAQYNDIPNLLFWIKAYIENKRIDGYRPPQNPVIF